MQNPEIAIGAVTTRPQNAAYRAVAFAGSAPDVNRERTCSWIAVQNCLILTQGASKIENNLYRLKISGVLKALSTPSLLPSPPLALSCEREESERVQEEEHIDLVERRPNEEESTLVTVRSFGSMF
ncbi:hypothetical protein Taro_020540 [Colocasia esculenta]|uniref:Uncharacterized protein n=1 Tax=Colocasia esculenta TaxID=4460 RepID=A0A843UWP1_COLES|nr:hypothetical protein [Colocasia esculenta]